MGWECLLNAPETVSNSLRIQFTDQWLFQTGECMPIQSKQLGLLYFLIGKVQCYWDHVETDLASLCTLDPTVNDEVSCRRSFYARNATSARLDLVESVLQKLPHWASLNPEWTRTRSGVSEAAIQRNALIHHHRALMVGGDEGIKVVQFNPKQTPTPAYLSAAQTLIFTDALKVWDRVIHTSNLMLYFSCLARDELPCMKRPLELNQLQGLTQDELDREVRFMFDGKH
jgi:hypothetical protein